MRKPVTTDVAVLQKWPDGDKPQTSGAIASALGITVFQITARLKGMEGRSLVSREKGLWLRTEAGKAEAANPSPSRSGTKFRQRDAAGIPSAKPDDSLIPLLELTGEDWCPSEEAFQRAAVRLPEIEERLRELKIDPKANRQAIMSLTTERDHCRKVVREPRDDRWTTRRVHAGTHWIDMYVAPDKREYVQAASFEVADILMVMPEGFPTARLRLYSTSATSKQVHRATREAEGRKAAREERLNGGNGEAEQTAKTEHAGTPKPTPRDVSTKAGREAARSDLLALKSGLRTLDRKLAKSGKKAGSARRAEHKGKRKGHR